MEEVLGWAGRGVRFYLPLMLSIRVAREGRADRVTRAVKFWVLYFLLALLAPLLQQVITAIAYRALDLALHLLLIRDEFELSSVCYEVLVARPFRRYSYLVADCYEWSWEASRKAEARLRSGVRRALLPGMFKAAE
jgi:hypothetical protein